LRVKIVEFGQFQIATFKGSWLQILKLKKNPS